MLETFHLQRPGPAEVPDPVALTLLARLSARQCIDTHLLYANFSSSSPRRLRALLPAFITDEIRRARSLSHGGASGICLAHVIVEMCLGLTEPQRGTADYAHFVREVVKCETLAGNIGVRWMRVKT